MKHARRRCAADVRRVKFCECAVGDVHPIAWDPQRPVFSPAALHPTSASDQRYRACSAASSISFTNASGCEIITTCEAPLTSTALFAPALFAMKA